MQTFSYGPEHETSFGTSRIDSSFLTDPTVMQVYALLLRQATDRFEADGISTKNMVVQIRKVERFFYSAAITGNQYCFTFSVDPHYYQRYAMIDIEAKTFRLK